MGTVCTAYVTAYKGSELAVDKQGNPVERIYMTNLENGPYCRLMEKHVRGVMGRCGVVWDYAYLTPTDFYATCIGCTISNR